MNKEGFTLIEMLIVIAIIAILSVLTITGVLKTVSNVRRELFKTENLSIVTQLNRMNSLEITPQVYTFTENGVSPNLDMSGKLPTGGSVEINDLGKIQIATNNGVYCAIKRFEDSDIEILDIEDPQCYSLGAIAITINPNEGIYNGASSTNIQYVEENSSNIIDNPYKDGYFFSGWSVSGSDYTFGNGVLKIGASGVTLTANYMSSSEMYTYTGNSTFINDGSGNWRIKFLTSGTFTPHFNMEIDSFLLGGGGGGGSAAGGGGGGGYTITGNNIALTAEQGYPINIGAGGAGGPSNSQGLTGGTSTAFGLTVNGGTGGGGWSSVPACKGGNGGSGGSGSSNMATGPAGGNDGNNGTAGTSGSYGLGQGTTTREFGLATGQLYGSGGGGANIGAGSNGAGSAGVGGGGAGGSATANTGGGGGGGGSNGGIGGAGGSGIVVIKNSTPCVGSAVKYCFKYTGKMTVMDGNTDSWKIKFLTGGQLTSYFDIEIDAFLVGGGGGGGSAAGGGGGGGYTITSSVSITANQEYPINIGAGGAGGPANSQGLTGGSSTAFGLTANGGTGGGGWGSNPISKGGNGGSGGSGSSNLMVGPAGGNDGNNGTAGNTGTFGTGQGTTTREFGSPTGRLYGSGGGGANLGLGSNGAGSGGAGSAGTGGSATANTGGGGGGGGSSGGIGGAGGSGIVIIRLKN